MTPEQIQKRKDYLLSYRTKNAKRISDQKKSVYDKEKNRIRNKKWYSKNKDKYLDNILRRDYGISSEELRCMLEKQKNVCLICSKKCKTGRRLSVDHDHKAGKVRGLLCNKCNNGLGNFDDDISLLKKAIKYIDTANVQYQHS